MSDKVILKDNVKDFIKSLMSDYVVVAPVPRDNAPAEFRELKSADEAIVDGSKFMMTPKDWLLPRYEPLFKVKSEEQGLKIEPTIPESKPTVMLGVWLPDAQAIQVLDRVFLDKGFVDPYYSARRQNLAVIAVIPEKLRWSWFCGSVDNVENWKKNVDAIMYDLGDRFYVETLSDKGGELINGAVFSDPNDSDIAAKNELWEKFKNHNILPFAGKELYANLEWENEAWAEIAEKCIACGMCSYMCPSCSCFDIQDETCGNCVERYRCRDTCQFEDFTLMGHGHNPRENQVPRSRQRLMHKFKYQHEQFGVVGCTGCGRCVELCPVNVDIRDVLTRTCSEEVNKNNEFQNSE